MSLLEAVSVQFVHQVRVQSAAESPGQTLRRAMQHGDLGEGAGSPEEPLEDKEATASGEGSVLQGWQDWGKELA